MQGWRFFQKPVGLELYFLKPELTFTFFLFIFFVAGCFLCGLFSGMLLVESAIKHPQAPQGMELKCSDSGIVAECMRSEVGGVAAIEQPPQDGNGT